MKKILLIGLFILVITLGIVGFLLYNNRTVSTIVMDINPSIEINLNKNNKVKSINALNEDAKDIISKDLKGKSLDDTLNIIVKRISDKGYIEDNQVTILLYSSGNIDNEELKNQVGNSFGEHSIATDIIVVDNINTGNAIFKSLSVVAGIWEPLCFLMGLLVESSYKLARKLGKNL